MMISRIRNSRAARVVAVCLSLEMAVDVLMPLQAFALTGGPSQPEVQSFEPISTSQMVDLFSGDMNYNIPLLDVGGYPINIAYHSGASMDQEASWVGLGWNVNPGVLNRNMRGIPDDFSGDKIIREMNMKPNITAGVTASTKLELSGTESLVQAGVGFGLGVSWNNYTGIGTSLSLSPSVGFHNAGAEGNTATLGMRLNSTEEGVTVSPAVSYSKRIKNASTGSTSLNPGLRLGVAINSRAGLQSLSLRASVGQSKPKGGRSSSFVSSASFGGSISLSPSTYVPSVDMARKSTSFSFSADIGGMAFLGSSSASFMGHYSKVKLLNDTRETPSYGYLYSQNTINTNVQHDFNREKDGAFTRSTPNLPITNHTYDTYSVLGQGIGSMFRPYRSEIGTVHDPYTYSPSGSGNFALQLDLGNAVQVGVDVNGNQTTGTSTRWTGDNKALGAALFHDHRFGVTRHSNSLYEPAYFKEAGERSVDDNYVGSLTRDEYLGASEPIRVEIDPSDINSSNFRARTTKNFEKIDGSTIQMSNYDVSDNSGSNDLLRSTRDKRNQTISYLTKNELEALDPTAYTHNSAQAHHLAQITCTNNDGARYVYGRPAYNTLQKNVTFNASGLNGTCADGFVTYQAGDNSVNNELGMDNYYSATTTPPFAHSYLITEVLSKDYEDSDDVTGPSMGDIGTYTKFTYNETSQGVASVPDYKWRVPYDSYQANFSQGMLADQNDDKGSYLYGTKDLWYLEKVETKTHVAIFHLGDRKDGKGVDGEDGGAGSEGMKRLDKIELFAKPDYDANGANATPIKTVHFQYDYTLCPGVSNNPGGQELVDNGFGQQYDGNVTQGKLTLKKLWFTYGNSGKGNLSPYTFNYSTNNPGYDLRGYDCWGNFKAATANEGCFDPISQPAITRAEFPYTEQTRTLQDDYAESWALKSIALPSGGTIDIDYESDSYSHVQDKKAMQMFKVLGVGHSSQPAVIDTEKLYRPVVVGSPMLTGHRDVIFFDMDGGSSNIDDYLGELLGQDMYFNFLVDIGPDVTISNLPVQPFHSYEYVKGYAKITASGQIPGSNTGWVQVEPATHKSENYNPIAFTGWNIIRKYMPRLAHGISDPPGGQSKDIIESLIANLNSIGDFFTGPYNYLENNKASVDFETSRSWIRLMEPDGEKLGGGLRVKQIQLNDNWEGMVNGQDGFNSQSAQYGQAYTYTLEDGSTSGIAANEPMAGGEQNPWRKPVYFTDNNKFVPDDENYQETPYGESFMPSPSVGYSRIVVADLFTNTPDDRKTGSVVHEFYTGKDFPIKFSKTGLLPVEKKSSGISQLLSFNVKDYMTATQGFAVETNDMHGKQKAIWYKDQSGSTISGQEHIYRSTDVPVTIPYAPAGLTKKALDNTVDVILPDGSVEERQIGVETDIVVDARQQTTVSSTMGVHANLYVFMIGAIPILVPPVVPSMATQRTRFRSSVTTKVVQRYGIKEATIAHDLGSSVRSDDLAYDSETGAVLLTRTTNEFDDPLYSFNYPAHWRYDGMGHAAANDGVVLRLSTDPVVASGAGPYTYTIPVKGQEPVFFPGDELLIRKTDGSASAHVWVYSIGAFNPSTTTNNAAPDPNLTVDGSQDVDLIDAAGHGFEWATSALGTDPVELKIIRSGRRNQHSAPLGALVLKENPISNGVTLELDGSKKIVESSAQLYGDHWKVFTGANHYYADPNDDETISCPSGCTIGVTDNVPKCVTNPYRQGILGKWRPDSTYALIMARDQDLVISDVRNNGILDPASYDPFWSFNSIRLVPSGINDWTLGGSASEYHPIGQGIEDRSALDDIYSAAVLGYEGTLPIAMAQNARYRQIGFSGFEDDELCMQKHFRVTDQSAIQIGKAHSGIYSLQLLANGGIADFNYFFSHDLTRTIPDNAPYPLTAKDEIGLFGPRINVYKDYLISFWINVDAAGTTAQSNFPEPTVSLSTATPSVLVLHDKSEVIDGWQKVTYIANNVGNAIANSALNLQLTNSHTSALWVDDIRIHPVESQMTTYVYHPESLRLWAELDDQNFATFYEYDEEGNLLRVKKETERGIMTIQESRSNTHRNTP